MRTTITINGLSLDAWEEGKHPRGQPGNAGEFSKGSGGGTRSMSETATSLRKENRVELENPHQIPEKQAAPAAHRSAEVVDQVQKAFPTLKDAPMFLRLELARGKSLSSGAHGNYSSSAHSSPKVTIPVGLSHDEVPLSPGGYVVNKNLPGIVRHELGHAYQSYILGKYRELNDRIPVNLQGMFRRIDKKRVAKELSTYATESPEEWFAESFSAYTHPEFKASGVKLDPKLQEIFEKTLSR